MATSPAWRGPTGQSRLFGAPPPLIFFGGKSLVALVGKPRARCAARMRALFFPPPRSGGGGPLELAKRANRGGGGAGLKASLSSENYRSLVAEISLNRCGVSNPAPLPPPC